MRVAGIEASVTDGAKNDPLAIRMGIVAGVSHNVVIGLIMGHFGLMLASAEQRLHVSAEQASLGIPLVLLGSALTAPFVGVLLAKVSLRLILLAGALFTVGGFAILGLTTSYPLYLIAYGLFFGPAMSLAGSIGPATLVTRWFNRNRGLAMGIVHLPVVIAILPVTLNWFLERNSATISYLTLSAIAAVFLVPLTLLAKDYPPNAETIAPVSAGKRTADGSLSIAQLLMQPLFWALCLAAIASMSSSVLLSSLLVPMGVSWGFTRTQSALMSSIMSVLGMVGSILFGFVADKLGGARSLALIAFDCAILWGVLLIAPPFPVVALVVGLLGMHGSGAIPTLSRGLSDTFGQASFSRGFGLNTVIGLPFIAFAIIGSAAVYTATGSYAPAILTMSGCFIGAFFLALFAARGRKVS